MKKKLITHIVDIATEKEKLCYQYTDGNCYYTMDGYRAIKYPSAITEPKVLVNAHAETYSSRLKSYFENIDGVMYQLPPTEVIKNGITEIAGKAYSIRVTWGNEKFNINARWLLKAMESLNATVCYIAEKSPHKNPIYFFENDDLQSDVIEMILPILKSNPNKIGFWEV